MSLKVLVTSLGDAESAETGACFPDFGGIPDSPDFSLAAGCAASWRSCLSAPDAVVTAKKSRGCWKVGAEAGLKTWRRARRYAPQSRIDLDDVMLLRINM